MKINYDNKQKIYVITLDDFEKVSFVNTCDIVTARDLFIDQMKSLFNNTICDQLKNQI